jgi:hypothetical protein
MGAAGFEMESGDEETLPDFKFGVPSAELRVGDLSSDRSKSGQLAFFRGPVHRHTPTHSPSPKSIINRRVIF